MLHYCVILLPLSPNEADRDQADQSMLERGCSGIEDCLGMRYTKWYSTILQSRWDWTDTQYATRNIRYSCWAGGYGSNSCCCTMATGMSSSRIPWTRNYQYNSISKWRRVSFPVPLNTTAVCCDVHCCMKGVKNTSCPSGCPQGWRGSFYGRLAIVYDGFRRLRCCRCWRLLPSLLGPSNRHPGLPPRKVASHLTAEA